jgi:hypothetical protein
MPVRKRKRIDADLVAGHLMIGTNGKGEVVIKLITDKNGVGHILFSPREARGLAQLLLKKADDAEQER